jgi:dTDP-4-dehydrorhamnose 3,5-epimerase
MAAAQIEAGRIDGFKLHALAPNRDPRGTLIELYREIWDLGCRVVQVNAVTSQANVLRGVHVHVRHADHLVLVMGRMILGVHDLRPWSPTAGASVQLAVDAERPQAAIIPPGVAHGFYFSEPAMHVYGVSSYWDPEDEIDCRWDCAEFGFSWPTASPVLSPRDQQAPDYASCRDTFLATWARVHGSLPARGAR